MVCSALKRPHSPVPLCGPIVADNPPRLIPRSVQALESNQSVRFKSNVLHTHPKWHSSITLVV